MKLTWIPYIILVFLLFVGIPTFSGIKKGAFFQVVDSVREATIQINTNPTPEQIYALQHPFESIMRSFFMNYLAINGKVSLKGRID